MVSGEEDDVRDKFVSCSQPSTIKAQVSCWLYLHPSPNQSPAIWADANNRLLSIFLVLTMLRASHTRNFPL